MDKEYQDYLKSPNWQKIRSRILKRDKVCVECKSNKATECHHLTYRHRYDERDYELVGVCRPCHEYIHRIRKHPAKRKPKARKGFIIVLLVVLCSAGYTYLPQSQKKQIQGCIERGYNYAVEFTRPTSQNKQEN